MCVSAADNSLVLPIAVGFLLKVVLVVMGGMIKLLFLGLTSLGTSGLALLLGVLFLKNNGVHVPAWPASPPPPGWHDRNWHPYRLKRIGYGYDGGWLRNGRQLTEAPDFYKRAVGKHNGVHPVPVEPRQLNGDAPHPESHSEELRTPVAKDIGETENATFQKRAMEHTQTYALTN